MGRNVSDGRRMVITLMATATSIPVDPGPAPTPAPLRPGPAPAQPRSDPAPLRPVSGLLFLYLRDQHPEYPQWGLRRHL